MSSVGRCAVLILMVWATIGCSTQTGGYVGTVYYLYGPETALRLARGDEVGPGERALIELERAMAFFELGRYQASLSALDAADLALAEDAQGAKPWRPDGHELVFMRTLALVNALALQDGLRAATRADAVIDRIANTPCSDCDWVFTRTLAALAYEEVGRYDDALGVLAGIGVEGDGDAVLDGIRQRCESGIAGRESEGLAPPPVTDGRTVTVALLLGIGPYRVPEKLKIGPDTTIKWHGIERFEQQGIASALLRIQGLDEPVPSIELTDVARLASAAGKAARAGLETAIADGAQPPFRDVRHWVSIPASLQLIEVTLPPETSMLELVALSPAGYEADTESIWIPETWIGGRLVIARRVP